MECRDSVNGSAIVLPQPPRLPWRQSLASGHSRHTQSRHGVHHTERGGDVRSKLRSGRAGSQGLPADHRDDSACTLFWSCRCC